MRVTVPSRAAAATRTTAEKRDSTRSTINKRDASVCQRKVMTLELMKEKSLNVSSGVDSRRIALLLSEINA
jgi:hypothetical protein